jgi:hypothetical protein
LHTFSIDSNVEAWRTDIHNYILDEFRFNELKENGFQFSYKTKVKPTKWAAILKAIRILIKKHKIQDCAQFRSIVTEEANVEHFIKDLGIRDAE